MAKIRTLNLYVIKDVKTYMKGRYVHCYFLRIECCLKGRLLKLGKIMTLKL